MKNHLSVQSKNISDPELKSKPGLSIFNDLLSTIATGIVILDCDQKIILANAEVARVSGFPDTNAFIKAFRNNRIPSLFNVFDRNGVPIPLDEIRQQLLDLYQVTSPVILGFCRKGNKTIRYLQASKHPFKAIDKKESYSIITLQEVTDFIVSQQKLLKNDQLLNLALNSSNGVAWQYNRQTGIVEFSEQIRTLLGQKKFNLSCPLSSFLDIIHPADRKGMTESVVEVIKGEKKELIAEYRILKPKGSVCHVLTKGIITARDENNTATLISGVFIDITPYKRIESELEKINRNLNKRIKSEIQKQQSQQIVLLQKSRLESLGELAAGIVHEINQPLGILSLQLDLLKDAVADNQLDKNQFLRKIDELFENINKINGIIDHIRTFAHQEKLTLPQNFDINTVLRKITTIVQPQFRNTNIDIKLALKEGIGYVNGSIHQFEQVILNLLSNARYALDEKSESGLYSDFKKEINITTSEEPENVVVNFTDNGTGIPQKLIRKLFDPFYTSKPADKGTGLGLPICYKIISGMNGNIHFESQKGEFTRVMIRIPKSENI